LLPAAPDRPLAPSLTKRGVTARPGHCVSPGERHRPHNGVRPKPSQPERLDVVPGMGELRYRFVRGELVAAGFRVAVMDLRGHGDSDATFAAYCDEPTAGDIAALITQLGGPALIVGNSMAAGSAVPVAAEHPELVRGLALIGPFVREHGTPVAMRLMLRLMMAKPWAAASWSYYLPKLYAGTKPADFEEYRTDVKAAIKRPGYAKAFSLTTRTRHDAAAAALSAVTAPTLVIMGERDPDFPAPAEEAQWIADRLHAEMLLVPDAGTTRGRSDWKLAW